MAALHPLFQEITDAHRGIRRDNMGRKVVLEGVAPHCVFGGFRMAREDWTRTDDGWDCDYDYEGLPATVYPTAEECREAIAALSAADRAEAA